MKACPAGRSKALKLHNGYRPYYTAMVKDGDSSPGGCCLLVA